MSPDAVRAVIPASATSSPAADLAALRAAPSRGIGTNQPGVQTAQTPTDSGAGAAAARDPTAADSDPTGPAGGSSAPAPATFGQTLAASRARPVAAARGPARKPTTPPPVPPGLVLASPPGANSAAMTADPKSGNAPPDNRASPEAPATTSSASAGTASPASGANALQSLSLMLGEEPASEPTTPQAEDAPGNASDSTSARSGDTLSKAAALPTPSPGAPVLMPRGFQTPGNPSAGASGQDLSAPDTDTRAPLPADSATLASEATRPKIEQLAVTAAGPGSSNDGAPSAPPAAAALTAAASTPGAAQTTAPSAPQAPAGPTVQVQAPVGSSGWAHEVGMRLHLLAQQGISSASLRLTPAQLGPVEVKISMHENAASVWFGAAQSETRSALELSLPKLRELFASQGLNLAHAGVSDQSARGARREPQPPAAATIAPTLSRAANATQVTSLQPTRQGLVDTYV
ncbi:MAG TPA: flagellar hook-length control protein FliK [Steroidobacteraceae bacterium]|nr:flagellar hook-length control protein FliK [Steroidobacteraceae bacterium]